MTRISLLIFATCLAALSCNKLKKAQDDSKAAEMGFVMGMLNSQTTCNIDVTNPTPVTVGTPITAQVGPGHACVYKVSTPGTYSFGIDATFGQVTLGIVTDGATSSYLDSLCNPLVTGWAACMKTPTGSATYTVTTYRLLSIYGHSSGGNKFTLTVQ